MKQPNMIDAFSFEQDVRDFLHIGLLACETFFRAFTFVQIGSLVFEAFARVHEVLNAIQETMKQPSMIDSFSLDFLHIGSLACGFFSPCMGMSYEVFGQDNSVMILDSFPHAFACHLS